MAGRLAHVVNPGIHHQQDMLVVSARPRNPCAAFVNRCGNDVAFVIGNLIVNDLGHTEHLRSSGAEMHRIAVMSAGKEQSKHKFLSFVGRIPQRHHGIVATPDEAAERDS
jgi:hypothetical protein